MPLFAISFIFHERSTPCVNQKNTPIASKKNKQESLLRFYSDLKNKQPYNKP